MSKNYGAEGGESKVSFDPILTINEMCTDGRLSRDTFDRYYRRTLPMIWVSPGKLGCRRSAWRAALAARSANPEAA
jgi:hypothetical protein